METISIRVYNRTVQNRHAKQKSYQKPIKWNGFYPKQKNRSTLHEQERDRLNHKKNNIMK